MTTRRKVYVALQAARAIGAVAMLGAVVVGALGYDAETKIIAAVGSGVGAVALTAALKATHLVA